MVEMYGEVISQELCVSFQRACKMYNGQWPFWIATFLLGSLYDQKR